MSLGPTIEYPSPWSAGLLWHERYLQALLAEAPPLTGHRGSGNFQGISDAFVGPSVGTISVGLEQNASVEQLARMSPAAPDERFELGALLFGEAHDILLVHGQYTPVSLMPTRIHGYNLLLNLSVTED